MTNITENSRNTAIKATIIYMSYLPLILIILLVLGAGYFLMADDIKLPKFNKGPQIRRLEGFPTLIYSEGPIEKQRKVIKSEEELNEFLNFIDPTGLLTLKESINFEEEYVIAVSSETEKDEEHKIKIRKVYEDKEDTTLLVSIQETFGGPECTVEEDAHVAVELVVINKTDWEIDFERIKKELPCKKTDEKL